MSSRILSLGLALALVAGWAFGQDVPAQPAPPAEATEPDAEENLDEPAEAADGDEANPESDEAKPADGAKVVGANKEKVRNLRPRDVAGELLRLKSKADIKAEIAVQTLSGRPVTFKGVIRNGKLIERIQGKRFVPEKDLEHPRCGVRLWWSGGSDGFIFFRYAVIKNIALTGKLTAAERREIFRRLKAKREGKEEKQAAPTDKVDPKLDKMSPSELKGWLLRRYPYDKGWNHDKKRGLQRKQLIENKPLSLEESVFLKYFHILVQARFEELKRNSKKIKIEPGSADQPESESDTAAPGDDGPVGNG